MPVQDIWLDFRDAHNQNIEITGYPTEKNAELLARIIAASSQPGDLVLDCFAGSGTTLAVASRLGRRWLGIDNSSEAIATILRRFTYGAQLMGDFGATRQPPPTSETTPATLPLFGDLDGVAPVVAAPRRHTPIVDFTLLSEASISSQLNSALTEWHRNHTLAPTMHQVKEPSATYPAARPPRRQPKTAKVSRTKRRTK